MISEIHYERCGTRGAAPRSRNRLLQGRGLGLLLAFALLFGLATARADDDLPGRVGRVAELAGEVFLAPQDAPEQWSSIGLNYPVAAGDNLWVGDGGRAEIDFGAGQFRLGGNTNLHLSRLDDGQFALFVAQGRVSVRLRFLEPGETAYIDTPNAQIVLTRPGLYGFEVSEDRQYTQLVVREGEANVQTAGALQQVLPGQTAAVEGAEPRFADVRNGIGSDNFDAWVANRDRRYENSRAGNYVSPQMVGAADLDAYGTWARVPEYGAVWYPNDVAPDWAPYRYGNWTDVGAWGPTWVDYAPWGYAPFHYGRWSYIRGRWGWSPGAYVARPRWAPALVGWTGGPGWGISVSAGAPVYGWVPLAWGEPYRPWWKRCSHGCWERYNRPYAVTVVNRPTAPPPRYINAGRPGGVSAMSSAALVARRPVQGNLVVVPAQAAKSAPILAGAPLVRAEPGRIPVPPRVVPGAPPPASTFYRTANRPVTLPGGGIAVAVPSAARGLPASPGAVPVRPSPAPAGATSSRKSPAGFGGVSSQPPSGSTPNGRERQPSAMVNSAPAHGGASVPGQAPAGGVRATRSPDRQGSAGAGVPPVPPGSAGTSVQPQTRTNTPGVPPAARQSRPETSVAQPAQSRQRQGSRQQSVAPSVPQPGVTGAGVTGAVPQSHSRSVPGTPAGTAPAPAAPGGSRAASAQSAKPPKPAKSAKPATAVEPVAPAEGLTRTR